MTGIAMLSGAATAFGLMLFAVGLRGRPDAPAMWPDVLPRLNALRLPSIDRFALVGGAALVALLITRWPIAAVAAGVAVALGRRHRTGPAAHLEMAEALTSWAEQLRDTTSTSEGVRGMLGISARNAPPLLKPPLQRFIDRLDRGHQALDTALNELAADLDHPTADLVVVALQLAAEEGGRDVSPVLDDLAVVAREEARMYRRIDVARERPRSDMRSVLVIMTAVVGLLVFTARDYLEPFGTATGQVVLALVVGCWATGVWAMGRMSRMRPVERFLGTTDEDDQ